MTLEEDEHLDCILCRFYLRHDWRPVEDATTQVIYTSNFVLRPFLDGKDQLLTTYTSDRISRKSRTAIHAGLTFSAKLHIAKSPLIRHKLAITARSFERRSVIMIGLASLADELLIEVFTFLRDSADLRSVSLAGQRRLTAASDVQLYRRISVTSASAIKLLRTLNIQAHVAPLVQTVDYSIGGSVHEGCGSDPRKSIADERRTLAEMLPLLSNLCELHLDFKFVPSFPFDPFVGPLSSVKKLKRAAIVGSSNMIPLNRLVPILSAWAPTLRQLELHGISCCLPVLSSLSLPPLPVLTDLRLSDPHISGSMLLAMCGSAGLRRFVLDCEEADDAVERGAFDVVIPTTQGILAVIEQHGSTLLDLTVRRGWLGSGDKDEYRFGSEALERCKKLVRLELHGQLCCRQMLVRGNAHIRELDLQFCSTICYKDVTDGIETGRWPSLKQLKVHHTGYEEDYEMSTVDDLLQCARRQGIKTNAGAMFGPFNAPNPPSPTLAVVASPTSSTHPRSARTPTLASIWPSSPHTLQLALSSMVI